ncbi:MAG: FAD-binding domain-containing protein, partial [Pseudomonadota bacterium]
FASIWIFTLRLPWELGADFFLRHLLDGDAAANTLSWRWVAGLQTPGKTYAARASNIAKYTEGRFRPQGLEPSPVPLDGTPHPPKGDAPVSDALDPDLPTGFLLHEDDLSPGFALDRVTPTATFVLKATAARSPLEVAPIVHDFVDGALDDCLARFKDRLGPVTVSADGAAITDWAAKHGCRQIVLAYPPTGPIADRMGAAQPALENAGLPLVRLIRPYDALAWPHATAGFFKFKAKIPHLISDLNLRPAA